MAETSHEVRGGAVKRQDPDLANKTIGELRREIMHLRRVVRKHRDARDNARCWHNDLELYGRTLPEAKPAGRMNLPESVLLSRCRAYVRRQQCGATCPRAKAVRS